MSQDNTYAAGPNAPYQNQYSTPTPNVPDYLVWAILETLFCCPPLGIVGIIYSIMANSAKQQSNFQMAMDHAKKAKLFLLIGIIAWLVFVALYIIFIVFMVTMGVALEQ